MKRRHLNPTRSVPDTVPEAIEIHSHNNPVTIVCATNWPDYKDLLAEQQGNWAGQSAIRVEMEFANGHILRVHVRLKPSPAVAARVPWQWNWR